MSEDTGPWTLSSVGAFLAGFFLGAGLLLVYHSLQVRNLDAELRRTLCNLEVLKKDSMNAKMDREEEFKKFGHLEKRTRELEKKK